MEGKQKTNRELAAELDALLDLVGRRYHISEMRLARRLLVRLTCQPVTPAHVDPNPTIAPGTLRRDPQTGEDEERLDLLSTMFGSPPRTLRVNPPGPICPGECEDCGEPCDPNEAHGTGPGSYPRNPR